MIQVSGVQFYNISSIYCILCLPPKIKSSVTIYTPLYPLPPSTSLFPLVISILSSVYAGFYFVLFFMLNPFIFIICNPPLLWQSVLNLWVCFYFVSYLFIRFHLQVRSWYLSFNDGLISLSIMLSSSIHAVAKGRSSFFLSAV